jgi:transmembrane sensor
VTDDIDPELLTRYLSHRCTADERRAVMEWAAVSPTNAAALDHAQRIWDESAAERESWDVAAGWRAVSARMASAEQATGGAPPRSRRRFSGPTVLRRAERAGHRWAMRALAAALVIAAGGTLLYTLGYVRDVFVPGSSYFTPPGTRSQFTLRDGSTVTLAPASRLWISAGFDHGDRRVQLDGEAMFTVVHDPRHPFHVLAGRIVATDVGTQFDVWHRDSVRVVVSVVSGFVSVDAPGVTLGGRGGSADDREAEMWRVSNSHVLIAGQTVIARIARDELFLTMNNAAGQSHTSWAGGDLVFTRQPVRDVAAELSRWYAIDIAVDSAVHGSVTLSTNGADYDHVLSTVAALVHARVVRRGGQFTFVPNPLNQQ